MAFNTFCNQDTRTLDKSTLPTAMLAVLGYHPSRVDIALALGVPHKDLHDPLVLESHPRASSTLDEPTFIAFMTRKMDALPPEALAIDAFDALATYETGIARGSRLTEKGLRSALSSLGVDSLPALVSSSPSSSPSSFPSSAPSASLLTLQQVLDIADLDADGALSRSDYLALSAASRPT